MNPCTPRMSAAGGGSGTLSAEGVAIGSLHGRLPGPLEDRVEEIRGPGRTRIPSRSVIEERHDHVLAMERAVRGVMLGPFIGLSEIEAVSGHHHQVARTARRE